jgi:hypothetical protein
MYQNGQNKEYTENIVALNYKNQKNAIFAMKKNIVYIDCDAHYVCVECLFKIKKCPKCACIINHNFSIKM